MRIPSEVDYGCTANHMGPSLLEVCTGSAFVVFMSLVENLIRDTWATSQGCEPTIPTLVPDDDYDFIVIGGGCGGSTVAGRLSEVPNWKVLLIEAGIDEPAITQVPRFSEIFNGKGLGDWHYKTEPEGQACLGYKERRCTWPRAKMLGGCTSIHGLIYTRGTAADYDGWETAGNDGWGYKDVLPWFKYSEDNLDVGTLLDEAYHGTGGMVTVSRFKHQPELAWDILKAAEELGHPVVDDIDVPPFTGFAIAQTFSRDGIRMSSARAFLKPARNRTNLNIMLNSTVTRIIVSSDGDSKRATGVELVYNGVTYKVKAKKEVILSAGTLNTPQVLLLSGIGPKDVLDNVGIEQVQELPGVGRNLTNHVSFTINLYLTDVIDINVLNQKTLYEYIQTKHGPLSSTGVKQVTAKLNSKYADPSGDNPDIQLFFRSYNDSCSQSPLVHSPKDPTKPRARKILGISIVNLHTNSRGYISLRSRDPFEAPIIVANYLTAPEDIEVLVDGIRIVQNLTSSPTLVLKYGIQIKDTVYNTCRDDNEYDSDDYWKCAIRYATAPENHQSSSCRMGPNSDEFAVVDDELKVYGIDGLRIADASIMPNLISGNMHATVQMIGEKAADFIKKKWLN